MYVNYRDPAQDLRGASKKINLFIYNIPRSLGDAFGNCAWMYPDYFYCGFSFRKH
jgi:hypothetical protein